MANSIPMFAGGSRNQVEADAIWRAEHPEGPPRAALDFAIPPELEGDAGPTTVYYCHTRDHELLYVGISLSRRGLERLADHSRGKDWWSQVGYVSLEHFGTRLEARRREAWAIAKLNPRHNIARPDGSPEYNEFGVRICSGRGCRAASAPGRRTCHPCARRPADDR